MTYFLDSYRKMRKTHVMRDTLLLSAVLFCILLTVSWALPRVFSFHFDAANTLSSFNSNTSCATDSQEDEGDIDILILGRG